MQQVEGAGDPARSADFPFSPSRNETCPPASFLRDALLSCDGGAGDCACLAARVPVSKRLTPGPPQPRLRRNRDKDAAPLAELPRGLKDVKIVRDSAAKALSPPRCWGGLF